MTQIPGNFKNNDICSRSILHNDSVPRLCGPVSELNGIVDC